VSADADDLDGCAADFTESPTSDDELRGLLRQDVPEGLTDEERREVERDAV
jgi:hypothetical protein